MNKNLSYSQRVHNANAVMEAENLQATHCYLHAASRSKEEWSEFWTRRDSCSWAHGFGRMRGFDQVWYGSVGTYDANTYENYIDLLPVYPEIGGMDPRPLMVVSMHTLASGVIEVADDGKTARAAFFTPGTLFSVLNDDKRKDATVLWERYGIDYIYEDGRWLLYHTQVCPDLCCTFDDVNIARKKYTELTSPAGEKPHVSNNPPPPCADPGPLHNNHSPVQPVQNTVPYPVPYAAMDNDNSYTRQEGGYDL